MNPLTTEMGPRSIPSPGTWRTRCKQYSRKADVEGEVAGGEEDEGKEVTGERRGRTGPGFGPPWRTLGVFRSESQ